MCLAVQAVGLYCGQCYVCHSRMHVLVWRVSCVACVRGECVCVGVSVCERAELCRGVCVGQWLQRTGGASGARKVGGHTRLLGEVLRPGKRRRIHLRGLRAWLRAST